MRQRLLLVLPLSMLLAVSACAFRVHSLGARSSLHPEPIDPEAGVCVVKSPDMDLAKWGDELTRKIELLLARDGYTVATSSEAEYYLFFDYKIRAVLGRVRLAFISGPQTGMQTVRREGPFVHSVALRVVDARAYRDDEKEQVVWQGGAVRSDVPTEGQRFHDMVLVAAFEQFDRETTETATIKLRRNDLRVRKLSR